MIKAIDASFAGNGCKYPTQSWIFFLIVLYQQYLE